MNGFIYLASPYTHPDADVRAERAYHAAHAAATLMLGGLVVYSPIVHGHALACACKAMTMQGHPFWMNQCYPVLRQAQAMYMLRIEGWEHSAGMAYELEFARTLEIPVFESYDGKGWRPL